MTKGIIKDLTFQEISHLSDQEVGEIFLASLDLNKEDLGKRYKEASNSHILFDDNSVRFLYQAQKLYCLGFYEASILVSRSVAEYVINELFEECLDKYDDANLRGFILDNVDFRKILNEYFKKHKIINREIIEKLNNIYDVGNKYVHPKTSYDPEVAKVEARDLIIKLGGVMRFLKTIFQKYDFIDGEWVKKEKTNYTGF